MINIQIQGWLGKFFLQTLPLFENFLLNFVNAQNSSTSLKKSTYQLY
ncbi:uncharacterized protein METZ01_LOCUS288286 [marine metagenome]|uniref:Uncharacterized protein n=1 Tax=marine metagenome TaxID=408172 RepID=A0A382LK35_9ZZZZ